MVKSKVGLFLLFVPFLTGLHLQESSQPEDPGRAAIEAYKAKNYPAYLRNLIKVREKYPHNLGVLSQVARAHALNDQVAESLALLRLIAEMGGVTDLRHKDLARLKGLKELEPIARAFERNRRPLNRSRIAFSIEQKDLIPEGIGYDDRERAFYVGSIYRNKIVRVDENGQTEDLIGEKQDGIAEVLGLRVDSPRRLLWVCASHRDSGGEGNSTSAVYKYDLRNRRLLRRYDSRSLPGKHLFNDIIPAKSGDVFLTDSEARSVLKISRETDELEVLIPSGSFSYPNGIALSSDERHLFVADQRGIHRFALQDAKLLLIKHAQTVSLAGVDGLYAWSGGLVGVQNGFTPERIIRVRLNESQDTASEVQVLESNHSLFAIPTTGAVVSRDFYFIANSQLSHLDEKGRLVNEETLKKPVILVVPFGG